MWHDTPYKMMGRVGLAAEHAGVHSMSEKDLRTLSCRTKIGSTTRETGETRAPSYPTNATELPKTLTCSVLGLATKHTSHRPKIVYGSRHDKPRPFILITGHFEWNPMRSSNSSLSLSTVSFRRFTKYILLNLLPYAILPKPLPNTQKIFGKFNSSIFWSIVHLLRSVLSGAIFTLDMCVRTIHILVLHRQKSAQISCEAAVQGRP